MQGRDIGLHPDPTLTGKVAESAGKLVAVFIVSVICGVSGGSGDIVAGIVAHGAVRFELSKGKAIFISNACASDMNALYNGGISLKLLGNIDPHTYFCRLYSINIQRGREAQLCGCNGGKANIPEVPRQLEGIAAETDIAVLLSAYKAVDLAAVGVLRPDDGGCRAYASDPEEVVFHQFESKLFGGLFVILPICAADMERPVVLRGRYGSR